MEGKEKIVKKRGLKVEHVCKRCGKKFVASAREGKRIFCSNACRFADKYIPHECSCIVCGKTFMSRKNGVNKYCSKMCSIKKLNIDKYGENRAANYSFGPHVYQFAEFCEMPASTIYGHMSRLKITKICLKLINPKLPIRERRKLLYQNATTENLENTADAIWEKIMDRELINYV